MHTPFQANHQIHRVCRADELEQLTRQGWRLVGLVENVESKQSPPPNPYISSSSLETKTEWIRTTHFLIALEDTAELAQALTRIKNIQMELQITKDDLSSAKYNLTAQKEEATRDQKILQEKLTTSHRDLQDEIKYRDSVKQRLDAATQLNQEILSAMPVENWGVVISKLPEQMQQDLATKLRTVVKI